MIEKTIETIKDFEGFCKEINNNELKKGYNDITKLCEKEEKIWEFNFYILGDDNRKNIFSLYRGLYFENIKCVQYRISTDESRFFEWFKNNNWFSNGRQNYRFIKLSDALFKLKERLLKKWFKDKISDEELEKNNLCKICYSSKITAERYFKSFYNNYYNYLNDELKRELICAKGCDEKRIIKKIEEIKAKKQKEIESIKEKELKEKISLDKIKQTFEFKEYKKEFWNWVHILKTYEGEWEWLYINWDLETEGHSIPREDYYDCLKKIDRVDLKTEEVIEEEKAFPGWRCPEKVNIFIKNKQQIFVYK